MGIIFSKSDDDLVGLCRIWSGNRDVDPMTNIRFVNDAEGRNIERANYEIACMNILNGAYTASEESKQLILANLRGTCINMMDPISMMDFDEFEQKDLNNIVFIDSSIRETAGADKKAVKHCYILESIADLISHARQYNPHAIVKNPLTGDNLEEYDIQKVESMVKYKIIRLLKAGNLNEAKALLSRYPLLNSHRDLMDIYNEQTVDQVTVITRQMNFDLRYPNGDLLLPQSVIRIGESAFDPTVRVIYLRGRLRLPNALREIMYKAFYHCKSLTGQLVIPNSVETIGMFAFSECDGFTSLVLPDNLTNIGKDAFSKCKGFTGDLILPRYLTTIADNLFSECWGFDGRLVIPDGVTSIGKDAFYGCSGFTGQLIIPNSVTRIAKSAFSGCRGFTRLVLSENLRSIEEKTFYGCTGITELVIPDSVKLISDNAFDGCTGLTGDIIINQNVRIMRSFSSRSNKSNNSFRFVKV